jgi:hypothetical protein
MKLSEIPNLPPKEIRNYLSQESVESLRPTGYQTPNFPPVYIKFFNFTPSEPSEKVISFIADLNQLFQRHQLTINSEEGSGLVIEPLETATLLTSNDFLISSKL